MKLSLPFFLSSLPNEIRDVQEQHRNFNCKPFKVVQSHWPEEHLALLLPRKQMHHHISHIELPARYLFPLHNSLPISYLN